MSNCQELPPATSGSSVPTPTELLSKMPTQPSAEFTSQPFPSLKLSLSIPKSLLESAPDVQNDNKDAGMAIPQSMIEMPHPFSNWKRNCYTLYEVDEKVSSPKVMTATMEAASGINYTDPATVHPYQALTFSSFNWKYHGYRNFSSEVKKRHTCSENQTTKINEFISKTQGQMTCKETNASFASISVESDLGARRAQSSTDLRNLEVESTSFGNKRNLSASDLKVLMGSIFSVSSNASGDKSKSVPASPISSPKSQRKALAVLGERLEKGKHCLDLQTAGTLSPSQFGNTDHCKEENNTPIDGNKTGLKKNTPPTNMMSSIVDWATKKKVTMSNSEINIFAPPSS
ncbi:hypothetical protein CHS0354_014677 [Potamilus streckersoni]|uniref:Uncharacterized protein n=1 Tax=Potamilus streckersoni TaxID=2493646 RepID=A0AAE0SPW7_9BIVA|nr:hypothetical protein CHS0354_014677 [Potamilus streckersoni]